ncbi:PH domain-containing protein [Microbacterium sp. F2E]|uniref:PH domain-containing protein n=1 Tax=Microbacterium sp. F2E TaxID=2895284 RepID=UPI001E3AC4AD|nr:PH domain-containing protein [Microbacterium sp. F2E]MCC9055111.1 PH domain-containing protein [Microbacterium sp. F2E]
MTNDPDQTSPDSVSPTTADALDAGTPAASDSRATDALDAGTYDRVLEPRSENRLPLGDGVWHQISRRYIAVQLISTGAFLALVVAAALVFWLVLGQVWILIPAAIVIVITLWTLAILPRQARAYGYQLRADDLVFRRGILWQRMVAVPYGRMQLVDITHGPLDRAFGIAQLKLVTAAAATGVTIPGLSQQGAEQLRDTLIAVAETRRTGL